MDSLRVHPVLDFSTTTIMTKTNRYMDILEAGEFQDDGPVLLNTQRCRAMRV
jgi:hypothetical protein